MKKVKFSFEQFNEFEKQQKIKDISERVIRDLAFLSSICSRKDKEKVLECIDNLEVLRNVTIARIDNLIDWE